MTTEHTTQSGKGTRTVFIAGITLLMAGFALFWVAEPLSWERLSGSTRRLNERTVSRFEFLGDRLSWLGVGLLVVSAFGRVCQPENQ